MEFYTTTSGFENTNHFVRETVRALQTNIFQVMRVEFQSLVQSLTRNTSCKEYNELQRISIKQIDRQKEQFAALSLLYQVFRGQGMFT